jgi:hypothetical protein
MRRPRAIDESMTTPSTNSSDKRLEPRCACDRELEILPCSPTREWKFDKVHVVDVSTRGLGLISNQPMAVGSQFLAKVKLKKASLLIYSVRFCAPGQGVDFHIGAEFSGFVADELLEEPGTIIESFLQRDAGA